MAKNIKVSTTEKFISSFSGSVSVGTIVETLGYSTEGDGGGASWKKTATTGTASQSPAQLVDGLLNDASGNQWALVSEVVFLEQLGVALDNVTDNNLALAAALAFQQHSYKQLNSGSGYCKFSSPFEVFSSTYIKGPMVSRSKSTTGNVNDDGLVFKYTGPATPTPLISCNLDGSQAYVHSLRLIDFRLDCGGS